MLEKAFFLVCFLGCCVVGRAVRHSDTSLSVYRL